MRKVVAVVKSEFLSVISLNRLPSVARVVSKRNREKLVRRWKVSYLFAELRREVNGEARAEGKKKLAALDEVTSVQRDYKRPRVEAAFHYLLFSPFL